MRRPQGYATFTSPDAPTTERDTCTCAHCNAIVFVKPGMGPSVYLIPQVGAPDREEPGAGCRRCMKPICLRCYVSGRCTPFERQIERMEARGRMLRAAGVG